MMDTLLEVSGLQVSFDIGGVNAIAVDGLSFVLQRGQTLGIVGESGSGKSISALAIMGLVPSPPGRITSGSIRFMGRELVGMDEETLRRIRGKDISMIFQEPMTALNPIFTVGDQIAETLMQHEGLDSRAAWAKAETLLAEVGIPEPAIRARNYPFELSGGMRQRVMIAIALACNPTVLIADEPTTALDVSVQAQIFHLLQDIQRRAGTSILFITHDMGSIAAMADQVIVMYAGTCVESGTACEILLDPRHPYTQGLIACIPHLHRHGGRHTEPLREIPGMVPAITAIGSGCPFAPRCELAVPECFTQRPRFEHFGKRGAACHKVDRSERTLI